MEASRFINHFLMTQYNEMLLPSFGGLKGGAPAMSLNTPLFCTFGVPKRRTTHTALNSQEHSATLPSSPRHASIVNAIIIPDWTISSG